MKLSSFVLPPILSLTLTLSPVLAQTRPANSENANVQVQKDTAPVAPSSVELEKKSADNGTQVLSALPPSDTSKSNPPGRTSKAVVVALIIGGAALAVGLYFLLRGGKTPATVLAPGTPTVGVPSH